MDEKMPTRSMSPQIIHVSKSQVPDDQSKTEDEVTVEMVLEKVTSDSEDLVTREVVAAQLNIIARESESPSVNDHVVQELQTVSEAAVVDEIQGTTVMEDIKNGFSDRTTEGVEHHSDRGTCSFVSGIPEVTVNDASAHDSASSVEGALGFNNPHQTTGVEYKPVNEGFRRNVIAEDMVSYAISGFISFVHISFKPTLGFLLRGVINYNAVPYTITKCSLSMFLFISKNPISNIWNCLEIIVWTITGGKDE